MGDILRDRIINKANLMEWCEQQQEINRALARDIQALTKRVEVMEKLLTDPMIGQLSQDLFKQVNRSLARTGIQAGLQGKGPENLGAIGDVWAGKGQDEGKGEES